MEAPTGYHAKLIELGNELVMHGWGAFTCNIVSLKDNTVKVEILCGKSYVFFIKKQLFIDESKLL